MSLQPPVPLLHRFTRVRRAAQRRAVAITLLQAFPIAIGAVVGAFSLQPRVPAIAVMVAVIGMLVFAALAWKRAQRFDLVWLLRRLDHAVPALEDSSALALAPASATRLQALQQSRVRHRIEAELGPAGSLDFRTPFPRPSLGLCLLTGLLLAAAGVVLPTLQRPAVPVAKSDAVPTVNGTRPKLVETAIHFEAPAYTGVPAQTVTTLDAKLPIDSRLDWRLRFDRDPQQAAIVFVSGTRLPLEHEGSQWHAATTLTASTLYRIELDGSEAAQGERLSRLDAIPDLPPEIIVRTPEKTLTVLTGKLSSWDFSFETRDDYGLGQAEMTVTHAQGSGEQVKVTEQTLKLEGGSDRHERSYRKTVDLNALGFAQGDDVIVRIGVVDNHPAPANETRSASYILRWPAAQSKESAGLDGLVQKTLPAYFRSERQIIIDTEALQAQRGAIPDARFAKQADELGVDQKVLRLRYGQFLGEGFESQAEHSAVEADAAKQSASGAGKDAKPAEDNAPSKSLAAVPSDAAQAPAAPPKNGLGQEEDVLHEYGHAHDNGEAATLLDPETRRILKLALDEMWQAELNLRQAKPEAALPYEYKALDYIKQVQQAERIYLQRAGVDLPTIDSSRRLSGERAGLVDRQQPSVTAPADDSPAASAWAAIERGGKPDTAALVAWLKEHPDATPDALDVVAAADSVQREPDCVVCRADLKARLWSLLPSTTTGVTSRRLPDATGAAYLDALKTGVPP